MVSQHNVLEVDGVGFGHLFREHSLIRRGSLVLCYLFILIVRGENWKKECIVKVATQNIRLLLFDTMTYFAIFVFPRIRLCRHPPPTLVCGRLGTRIIRYYDIRVEEVLGGSLYVCRIWPGVFTN